MKPGTQVTIDYPGHVTHGRRGVVTFDSLSDEARQKFGDLLPVDVWERGARCRFWLAPSSLRREHTTIAQDIWAE